MKILHSADLHFDTPFTGKTKEQAQFLRQALLEVPGKLAELCKKEGCDLMLLCGDLFDGHWTKESFHALSHALADVGVPVFISPGNHDFCGGDSPYLQEIFPSNVHIFTKPVMEAVTIETLDCRVYGAGYRSMDCPGLLRDFQAEGTERYHIGLLHGDPVTADSPYCPITQEQIRQSALDYLALGHIHKGGSVRCGDTLCAWPGCPMGKGYDETGSKGVLIVTLEDTVETRFVPLDTPAFYDLQVSGEDAQAALSALLPGVGNRDFYRVTFTGESDGLDIPKLLEAFAHFPHLELRDNTVPKTDIWGSAAPESAEGIYFGMLKDAMEGANAHTQKALTLAARISRQILNGQEVILP